MESSAETLETSNGIISKIYKKDRVRRHASLLLGLLLISIAFNLFLLPNSIVFGGVSGISIITKEVFGWNPSIVIYIGSLILLIVSFIVLGIDQTTGSVLGSLLFPIFVQVTANIGEWIPIGEIETFLAVLFGGVLYGLGAGLVFKAGFTTGGTDIINQIISKYVGVSMGTAMLMSDGLIVLGGVTVFGVNKLMYAIIVVYLIGMLTDRVLLGISNSKAFYIIAEKQEEIRNYILNELGHGVTIFDAKGGYSMEKEKVLFCVVPTDEYYRLKEGIHEIDQKAFFVVMDAYEVFGGE